MQRGKHGADPDRSRGGGDEMARVLVVEDNAQIRELIGVYLKQAGHAVPRPARKSVAIAFNWTAISFALL